MKKFDYQSLKEKLETGFEFPLVYMFKFIIPSENQKIAKLSSIFDEDAELNIRKSSKGKFTSITIKSVMISADEIITKYKKASEIKGLLAL